MENVYDHFTVIQPFMPFIITKQLEIKLQSFIQKIDFSALYKEYSWKNDAHHAGLPDIFQLELQLSSHERTKGITACDISDVARWGGLTKINQIQCAELVLKPNTIYAQNGKPHSWLKDSITRPLDNLKRGIFKGIGPTYLSKILRFACPQEFGAIDTRCVRVFGDGDNKSKCHSWLDLHVRNYGRWFIPESQEKWPSGYGRWIDILRYFAHHIPQGCPHPAQFVNNGLRSPNIWTCADVEMALFTYASRAIKEK